MPIQKIPFSSPASASQARRSAVALACALLALSTAQAKPQADAKLGLGLGDFVAFQRANAGNAMAATRAFVDARFAKSGLVVLDAQGRVRVDVHLDGTSGLDAVQTAARALGLQVVAQRAGYRHGMFTAYLPAAQAEAVSRLPGVRSVLLSPAPVTNVGKTTAQGAVTVKADQVNALGLLGQGITVGALSDSYDVATNTSVRAATDVRSGDLPGPGNPNGYTQPVVVLEDIASGTDEGRGMLQIVHDLAPASKLCFATAFNGLADFANNIISLADKSGPCGADVIVDDVIYFFEPMFSDGLLAQAVDQVAAQGVSYFSSAGNRGSTQAYDAGFSKISDAAARSGSNTVNLALIAPGDTDGGFHNFNPAGAADLAQTVTMTSASNTLVLQWDDPFDSGAVTTDYDMYVFDATGTQLVAVSADDNLATDEPVEAVQIGPGTYQIVVARHNSLPSQPVASQLRYINFGSVSGGEYLNYKTPATYGHNSAKGAIGTAALPWFESYQPESFTSPGPSTIYFDALGNRLVSPEFRRKPDIAAPDGVNTTFFPVGGDSAEDADSFPNFFGTSAAAPHGAGVAALVLEKAGGPGKISPTQMRRLLQRTAVEHDLNPNTARAVATAGPATVVVQAQGDGGAYSGLNAFTFSVGMRSPNGYTLLFLTIDLATANPNRTVQGVSKPGMQFDPRVGAGFPLTIGKLQGLNATDVTFSPLNQAAPFSQRLKISFAPGSFSRVSALRFGVDRDETSIGAGGNAVDLLAGARITGVVLSPTGEPITFDEIPVVNRMGKGYSPLDGFGLIDALAAVQALP